MQGWLLGCILPAHLYSCVHSCWVHATPAPGSSSQGLLQLHRTLVGQIMMLYRAASAALSPPGGMQAWVQELVQCCIHLCCLPAAPSDLSAQQVTPRWCGVYGHVCVQLCLECVTAAYSLCSGDPTSQATGDRVAGVGWLTQVLEHLLQGYIGSTGSRRAVWRLLLAISQLCTQLEGADAVLLQRCQAVASYYSNPSGRAQSDQYYSALYTLLVCTHTSCASSAVAGALHRGVLSLIQTQAAHALSHGPAVREQVWEWVRLRHVCAQLHLAAPGPDKAGSSGYPRLSAVLAALCPESTAANCVHKMQLYIRYAVLCCVMLWSLLVDVGVRYLHSSRKIRGCKDQECRACVPSPEQLSAALLCVHSASLLLVQVAQARAGEAPGRVGGSAAPGLGKTSPGVYLQMGRDLLTHAQEWEWVPLQGPGPGQRAEEIVSAGRALELGLQSVVHCTQLYICTSVSESGTRDGEAVFQV